MARKRAVAQAAKQGDESAAEATEREMAAIQPMTPEEIRQSLPAEPDVFDEAIASRQRAEQPVPAEPPPADSHRSTLPKRSDGSRGWATRYAPPEVQYDVLTKHNAQRKPTIFIKFQGIRDGEKPSEEILAVMRSHKLTPEGYPTGLHFADDRIEGKAWTLPDSPQGRDTLYRIMKDLDGLATKVAAEKGWER